ncbi:MAG TPA: hypothetical protein VE218_12745 [Acidobacteriaceae bacterium]|nr:hypothetical protein [Acidobacteriaceae bacterium]
MPDDTIAILRLFFTLNLGEESTFSLNETSFLRRNFAMTKVWWLFVFPLRQMVRLALLCR